LPRRSAFARWFVAFARWLSHDGLMVCGFRTNGLWLWHSHDTVRAKPSSNTNRSYGALVCASPPKVLRIMPQMLYPSCGAAVALFGAPIPSPKPAIDCPSLVDQSMRNALAMATDPLQGRTWCRPLRCDRPTLPSCRPRLRASRYRYCLPMLKRQSLRKVATLERFRARTDYRRRSRYISTLESAKFSGQWLEFSRPAPEDAPLHPETNEHTNNREEPAHSSTVPSTMPLPQVQAHPRTNIGAQSMDFEVRGELQMTTQDDSSSWTYSLYLKGDHRSLPLIICITARCASMPSENNVVGHLGAALL
jgi:hypothetical protein